MSPSSLALLAIMGIAIVTVLGDYFFKVASQGATIRWPYFAAGCLIYGLTAFGWVYGMRHLTLATLGVVFAVTMVLFMAALGVLVFKETLTRTELLGIGLAVVALILLGRHSG